MSTDAGAARRSAGARDRLPPRLGDRPLQLPLHLLRPRRRRRPQRARGRAFVRGDRRAGEGLRRPRRAAGAVDGRRADGAARAADAGAACCARSTGSRRSRFRPTGTCWPSWRRRCARPASIASTSASTRSTRRSSGASRAAATWRACSPGSKRRARPGSDRSSSTPSPSKGFNDDEVAAICRFAWERELVPRFIEEMPMAAGRTYLPGDLPAGGRDSRAGRGDRSAGAASSTTAGATRAAPDRRAISVWPRRPTSPPTPARRFGIISPMTEHFCATCNRLRLSATGAVHACLGYDDAVDLRGPAARRRCWTASARPSGARSAGKRDGHTFQLIGLGGPRKAMVQIGG